MDIKCHSTHRFIIASNEILDSCDEISVPCLFRLKSNAEYILRENPKLIGKEQKDKLQQIVKRVDEKFKDMQNSSSFQNTHYGGDVSHPTLIESDKATTTSRIDTATTFSTTEKETKTSKAKPKAQRSFTSEEINGTNISTTSALKLQTLLKQQKVIT